MNGFFGDFFRDFFSEVRWGRIVLTSLGVVAIVIILNFVFYYLAKVIWYRPDQSLTAIQVSSWTDYGLLLLLTLGAGIWVARTVKRETGLSGVLLGICVGAIVFFVTRGFGTPLLNAAVTFVLTMAAGFIGGLLSVLGRGNAEDTEDIHDSKFPYR